MSLTRGYELMGIARSTDYETPADKIDDAALPGVIVSICDEYETYGWRRVRAALRQRGIVANHKRIRRLMPQHELQPKVRRRFVAMTDTDHDGPIFPYDNAKAESSMKTLKIGAVRPMAFGSFEDVATCLAHCIDQVQNRKRLHSALGHLITEHFEEPHVRRTVKMAARICPASGAPLQEGLPFAHRLTVAKQAPCAQRGRTPCRRHPGRTPPGAASFGGGVSRAAWPRASPPSASAWPMGR